MSVSSLTISAATDFVNFDVPGGRACSDHLIEKNGVLCQSVRVFEQLFFCTVYSSSSPPESCGSRFAFPSDLLVMHHSPRWLSGNPDTKNWQFWPAGTHEYLSSADSWTRSWTADEKFRNCIDITYMHIDVPLQLRRGDVLAIKCKTITFADIGDDGSIVIEGWRKGVFGTEKCPFVVADEIAVYKNWPTDPSIGITAHLERVAAATQASPLRLCSDLLSPASAQQ